MALSTKTSIRGVGDCKIYPITADTAAAYTLGTGVDVPSITSFTIEPQIERSERYGDDAVQEIYSEAKTINFTVECTEMDLAVLAATLGGTVTASGSTPNQKQSYGYNLGAIEKEFQIAFKIDYTNETETDVADVHVHLMKCKIDASTFGSSYNEFGNPTFSGVAVNTVNALSSGKAMQVINAETAAALAAITA